MSDSKISSEIIFSRNPLQNQVLILLFNEDLITIEYIDSKLSSFQRKIHLPHENSIPFKVTKMWIDSKILVIAAEDESNSILKIFESEENFLSSKSPNVQNLKEISIIEKSEHQRVIYDVIFDAQIQRFYILYSNGDIEAYDLNRENLSLLFLILKFGMKIVISAIGTIFMVFCLNMMKNINYLDAEVE